MLARNERVERARSIRRHLKDYIDRAQTSRNMGVNGVPRELRAARDELSILIRLETPDEAQEGGHDA